MKILLAFLIVVSCSQLESPHKAHAPKEFSPGEIILATQLLSKIFDGEMPPLSCVPDNDEASLFIRTIHPRMELVQDELESVLDDPKKIEEIIQSCDQNCTCFFMDELFREHLVTLNRNQKKILDVKKSQKEVNRCMSFIQQSFCQGELYKELNKEKEDFSFEE
jgi:hypothetical protein